jgi:hypothetical protein
VGGRKVFGLNSGREQFGLAVAVSGDTAVIGKPLDDSNNSLPNDHAGLAFAFSGFQDCGDGRNNDADLFTDFPEDPGCDSFIDPSEKSASLVCDDGIDNDGDGDVDLGDDGCCSLIDPSEEGDASGDIEVAASLDFGSVPVGTTLTLELPIRNWGEANLVIHDAISSNSFVFKPKKGMITIVSLGLAALALRPGCGRRRKRQRTIAAGSLLALLAAIALAPESEASRRRGGGVLVSLRSCKTALLPIEFKPSAAVPYTETLTIRSNDPDEDPTEVTLLGAGTP